VASSMDRFDRSPQHAANVVDSAEEGPEEGQAEEGPDELTPTVLTWRVG
jgi:hypothetical protein